MLTCSSDIETRHLIMNDQVACHTYRTFRVFVIIQISIVPMIAITDDSQFMLGTTTY